MRGFSASYEQAPPDSESITNHRQRNRELEAKLLGIPTPPETAQDTVYTLNAHQQKTQARVEDRTVTNASTVEALNMVST